MSLLHQALHMLITMNEKIIAEEEHSKESFDILNDKNLWMFARDVFHNKNIVYCIMCNKNISSANVEKHVNSMNHVYCMNKYEF